MFRTMCVWGCLRCNGCISLNYIESSRYFHLKYTFPHAETFQPLFPTIQLELSPKPGATNRTILSLSGLFTMVVSKDHE